LLGCSLAFSVAGFTAPAVSVTAVSATPAPAAKLELSYFLTVADAAAHRAAVLIEVRGAAGAGFSLSMDPAIQSEGLNLADDSGTLPFSGAPGRIVFGRAARGIARIRYTVDMNSRMKAPGDGPRGYLCASYLLTSPKWVFFCPDQVEGLSIAVGFLLPPRWRPVVPWVAEASRFIVDDPRAFRDATIGAGRFEERSLDIGGTLVRVAIDERHEADFREALFSRCFATYAYIKGLFGASGPVSHLSILAKPEGRGEWQFLNESGTSQGEAVDSAKDAIYQYAHRVFHTYNGFYPVGMSIEPTWFLEGVAEYYGRAAMALARAEYPFAGMATIYDSYLESRPALDASLAGDLRRPDDYRRERFLAYEKGALVALLLDREIRSRSGGTKGLAHALADLYARYGAFGLGSRGRAETGAASSAKVDEAAIEAAASRAAGVDISAFFKRYVENATSLEMGALFADIDLDGIPAAGEGLLGTRDDAADSDGDGFSDTREFFRHSDPLDPKVFPREPSAVDGFGGGWKGNEIFRFGPLRARVEASSLYLSLAFEEIEAMVRAGQNRRYYVNLDTDLDGVGDYHIAAVYRSPGDFSRFDRNWNAYGFKSADAVPGLECSVGTMAEFKIPLDAIGSPGRLRLYAGIWDGAKGEGLRGAGWIDLDIDALARAAR